MSAFSATTKDFLAAETFSLKSKRPVMPYFHFTLGPVQSFVGQARRTKDFWAGSFLLSWLSGVAMVSVEKQGGSILFPQADPDFIKAIKNGAENGPKQGTIPNRFKAEVGSGFDRNAVCAEVQQAWKELADQIYKEEIAAHILTDTKAIWDRQVAHFWDMSWVLTTEKNDHSPCPNFSDTKPSDTKNSDINNTSSNNTNLNKTTTNKKSVVVFSSATQKETDVEKEVILKAEICGIKKQTIKKYINQQGLDNVLTQINNLDNAIIEGNKNGNPIANPGAWLYTALKEGFIDTKAIQKAKSKEKADTIQKAAEEVLFSDNKETTTIDPSSPFTKIATRIGVIKVI